jgi:hypothetical protein
MKSENNTVYICFFLVWLRGKVCLFHLHDIFCCPLIRYLISGLFRFTNAGLSIPIYISLLVIYIHTWLPFNRYELLPIGILILLNLPNINCLTPQWEFTNTEKMLPSGK